MLLCARQHSFKSASPCNGVNSRKARGRKSLGALLSADLEHKKRLRLGAGSPAGRREHPPPPSALHMFTFSALRCANAHAAIFAQPPAYCAKQRDQTKVIIFLRERKNAIGRIESNSLRQRKHTHVKTCTLQIVCISTCTGRKL